MLSHLQIENFALIDKLALDFHAGMTVLTGETGAGKSIIIDALDLVLGGRFDAHYFHASKEKMDLTAVFDLAEQAAGLAWLVSHELDAEQDCVLRRQINPDGRSRAFINGKPVPLNLLKELGNLLLTIHGQHEHQALLAADEQRAILDAYAQTDLTAQLKSLSARHRELTQNLQDLQQREAFLLNQKELLQFQVDELVSANLQVDELPQLDTDQRRLANAQHLLESGQHVLQILKDDEQALLPALEHALSLLNPLQKVDDRLSNVLQLLEHARIHLDEGIDDLTQFLESTELDPTRLQVVEERLSLLHRLARKHHVNADELPALQQNLETQLTQLANEANAENLQNELNAIAQQYNQLADKLTRLRQKAAQKLSAKVTEYMQQLGMKNGHFEIALTAIAAHEYPSYGREKIEFLVCTNPGSKALPLAKIASGGELSRISLAIDVIASEHQTTPTLIFDEVDVGISGATAAIVGKLLHQLCRNCQIFCVTHSPQVAAFGTNHPLVHKTATAKTTKVSLTPLSKAEKIKEIARILGGTTITKTTLAHAQELIEAV